MNQINNSYTSIEQATGQYLKQKAAVNTHTGNSLKGLSFQEVLAQQRQSQPPRLKFSKHATERLSSRNIDLTNEQMDRLQTGTLKASEKGIKESLVMVDDLAFIVNVKNNTVVTAVNDGEDKVFTNIDGAVII